MKLITVVLADDVILVFEAAAVKLEDVFRDKVRVTALGTPLNVKRICVPFATCPVVLLENWVAVRQALPNPSLMYNEPDGSGTERLVKIVAVPALVLP